MRSKDIKAEMVLIDHGKDAERYGGKYLYIRHVSKSCISFYRNTVPERIVKGSMELQGLEIHRANAPWFRRFKVFKN